MTKRPTNEELQKMWQRACDMVNKHIGEMTDESYIFGRFYISAFIVSIIVTHPEIKNRDNAQEMLFEILESVSGGLDNYFKEVTTDQKMMQSVFFDMMAGVTGTDTGKPN